MGQADFAACADPASAAESSASSLRSERCADANPIQSVKKKYNRFWSPLFIFAVFEIKKKEPFYIVQKPSYKEMLGFLIFLLAMAVLAFCAAPPSMTNRLQNRVQEFKALPVDNMVRNLQGPVTSL
jgi:hypothetical protein